MKTWSIGGLILVLGILAVYAAIAPRTTPRSPATAVEEATASTTECPAPPTVAPLPPVVAVTDIDHLLDPPAIPVVEPASTTPVFIALGAEPTPAPRTVDPTDVRPIPPAIDEE